MISIIVFVELGTSPHILLSTLCRVSHQSSLAPNIINILPLPTNHPQRSLAHISTTNLLILLPSSSQSEKQFHPSALNYSWTSPSSTAQLNFEFLATMATEGKETPPPGTPTSERPRSFFGRNSASHNDTGLEEPEKMDKGRPTKWSMGVLNDPHTHEVPGVFPCDNGKSLNK